MSLSFKIWRKEAGETITLAAPLIVAQLLQAGMGFIDTVMAGQLGARDLAAVGLGAALWGLVLLACVGATMAISPLVAHLHGGGRDQEVAGEFQQGLWVALLVGILAVPATWYIALLIPWMNVAADVAELATDYLHTIAWGMPGLCLYLAPRYLFEGLGNTKPVMLVQFVLLPLNILGNYIFMYGNFGMPALGAQGAALSTAIGLWSGALMMFIFAAVFSRFRTLNLFHSPQPPSLSEMAKILKLGLPIAVAIVMEVGMFTAIALLMGSLGKVEMAAHQIALNYASLMFMMPLGIAQAITIRVGHAAGAGNYALARTRGWVGISMAGMIMLCSATFLLLFPERVVSLYTSDPDVATMAMTLLFAAALFQFSDGLQVSASGALRGLKDTTLPMIITIISYWLIGFPAARYLGMELGLGPQGLWGGLLVGLTIAALLLNLRFFLLSRRYA
ncbi:MAG: MATE family efflux transporter [Sedimenticola sp.]|nr:MAG: MATE family efflux transporter [Sedimenticola sp.]